jgi:WD40 repeat protein
MYRVFCNVLIIAVSCLLFGCIPQKSEQQWQVALNGAYSGAIGQRGQSLVLGSFQHGGSYWDITKFAREFSWNHREGYLTEILYSDISADGQYAMTANYYNLVLWNTNSGESVWFWSAPARIESADLSADGRFALLGLDNNKAVLFDVQNGGLLREFEHAGPVSSVAINVAAGLVLTGSEDNSAKLWNLRNAELIRSFDYRNQVSLVALSRSGNIALMVPANEKAELWNLDSRQKIANLKTAKFRLYSARFVGDQRLLTGTTHRNIFEFDTATGKKTNTWQIGTEGKQAFKSAIVLDVGWRGSQLIAIGSNGYLYAF